MSPTPIGSHVLTFEEVCQALRLRAEEHRPLFIYLSSSWKNRERVRALAIQLRELGHEVYDFTDPSCRKSPEIPPERFPKNWDPEDGQSYEAYLRATPEWKIAVNCNRDALMNVDLVVLLLPAGADAHADAYYGLGQGARLVVLGAHKAGDRTPTHLWAERFFETENDLIAWLEEL